MRDVKEPEIRRAEIMNAAMLLFMEKGYTNTTTQDIVDKVNISRGLLYYHFKNKEDILYCLVEQYSDKLLKDIHIITYDDKTAIEKIRSFMNATIISSENISAEGTVLQKTVDLKENQYMIDKLSHKLVEKLTIYFEKIINQGITEKVFFVKYPSETAEFLMTAYVFVSNNISIRYSKKEPVNDYLNAFKIMLEQSLNTKKLFSNQKKIECL
ncbi:TetR/AcrR family transcriptional regulator [Treponema sp. OMZ 792]|uniref:TetR/AcrR family transcriptional regulator n=1 Tax=unclassified Treponema TaxID=2638727 RepID=UPI0020A2DD72|nr:MULTISPECIES: TetR/AcrR family transcriptional regulator [unclassified Treponema]UTC74416.1 TetR/AcrR family transcriptional regulator [Treponema sp. OMZ 792]UTC77306.1 TetR/AcrR family transcriptional regulator [Treponema sp. OMZ 799]UTC80812.1 TetR/AcrR family transcriptional regulator [Treponema sp. OMZ 798]